MTQHGRQMAAPGTADCPAAMLEITAVDGGKVLRHLVGIDAGSNVKAGSLGHKNSFIESPQAHSCITGLRLMTALINELKHSSRCLRCNGQS